MLIGGKMHKYYVYTMVLCFHASIFGMAEDTAHQHPDDLLKTVALLQERDKKALDRSQKEELMLKKHHEKRKVDEQQLKERLKQEILEIFPGTPTPDSLEELRNIHALLKNRLKEEILSEVPGAILPDNLYKLKTLHKTLVSDFYNE